MEVNPLKTHPLEALSEDYLAQKKFLPQRKDHTRSLLDTLSGI